MGSPVILYSRIELQHFSTMAVNTGYIANNSSLVTVTLPSTSAVEILSG